MTSNEENKGNSLFSSKEEIKACQFHEWYPTFRRQRATIRSVVIPLEGHIAFIKYLLNDSEDGLRLPSFTRTSAFISEVATKSTSDNLDMLTEEYDFRELDNLIEEGIEKLGGTIMPKLNWSSPKDASWINGNGSLKCKNAGDVYLLLKSSDFIIHDLLYAFDGCARTDDIDNKSINKGDISINYHLILRKWCNLFPSMEFRCFVSNHRLIAISQRNHSQYYPHLEKQKLEIQDNIASFFIENVKRIFADGKVQNYVFDCYIDKGRRVWLIDFNVWGETTDSLLFDWNELKNLSPQIVEHVGPKVRFVCGSKYVRPDPLASYRAPIDTLDLTSKDFAQFMSLCTSSTNDEDSSAQSS
mmetsp:Transcript_8983/g.11594  ORF Transcript_8983/g.11594 Transcript_8983/m.11594 type:complete len:357 (+) Transcript_8983:59-1129(+)